MSSDNPTRNADGTFKKGFTANRNGAPPKSQRKRTWTAFDILFDETFEPIPKDLPPGLSSEHEAAYRTYVAALKKGSKRARRLILKHIQRRDQDRLRLAKLSEPTPQVRRLIEPHDPTNVDEALLILGIAREDTGSAHPKDRRKRLKLMPWAVQAALGRRHGNKRLSGQDIIGIKLVTADADQLRWPRSYNAARTKMR